MTVDYKKKHYKPTVMKNYFSVPIHTALHSEATRIPE